MPYEAVPRRPGDIAECWADPRKARDELGWTAQRSITEIMADAWRWQSLNPHGYAVAGDDAE
ncbi:UDP-glucose 4-epimerase [compost metagenome]